MRFNIRNTTNLLVYCTIFISTSASFMPTETLHAFNSSVSEKKDESAVNVDSDAKFKWISSGDMVAKIPINRRLDDMGDAFISKEELCADDINDLKQPRSHSGQDSFWALYKQLDSGKKGPIYNRVGGGSKPVLTRFRYAVVPIWWSDEDTSDTEKEIQIDDINSVMKYTDLYYNRMSFGKFNFDNPLILSQTVIPVNSSNPGFGDLETAARNVISLKGYTVDADYDGIVILYNVAQAGPFNGHGGWGTVNSGASVTWMSWRHGLSNDVARHEFGHNFGHPHHLTNKYKWRFGKEGVVGYDNYDMMSGGNGYDISDFALASKWFFGWVPDSSIINMQPQGSSSGCPTCVSQGTYTLYPFDGNDVSQQMGIHIPITSEGNTLYSYWLSYRSGNPAKAGLSIHISWFAGIGFGQFGASYDSLNYDVHGDTDTRLDSFVVPGTCYHISPSIKMLEIDPIAAIATQPKVCVAKLLEGSSITVNVSFPSPSLSNEGELAQDETTNLLGLQSPNLITNNKIVMECGTNMNIEVDSNMNQLLHVNNTGKDGILTLNLCPSSGSATAYMYDRYPTSPLEYSAPGGYGAFKGLKVSTPCLVSKATEYSSVHNEAWVLIEADAALTVEASCVVNVCQVGQKKVRGKCLQCQGNDTGCERCPGGLEFYISNCFVSETFKEISESTKWRIWAPEHHTLKGWVWDVKDLEFYSDLDCTDTKFNDGTPIDSGNAGQNWGPERAFDDSDGSAWGGRKDQFGLFWIGMDFNTLRGVHCISFLDYPDKGVKELRVQAWESSTSTWHNVKIVKDHQSGVRTKISLEYTPTPPPVASPTLLTSNPTASPITPTLMPTQAPAAPTQTPIPDNVFWDNNWPSDLISVGEFNNDDDNDGDKVLDFLPLEKPHVISGQTNLNLIGNDPEKAQVLTDIFNGSDSGEVEVKTWNGAWIQELYLPDASNVPNFSEFQLTCGSSWSVEVHYNNGNEIESVSIGNYLVLAVVEGVWITEGEYDPSSHPTAALTKASEKNSAPLLEGTVLFAQSQIFPSKHGINGDSQPHLTALRKTLVMLRPHKISEIKETEGVFEGEVSSKMMMIVRNVDGTVVSSDPIKMKEPDDIPKQSGWVDLGDTDIDSINFPSSLVEPYVIKYQSNLDAIKDDKIALALTDIMTIPNQHEVEIQTWNGSWVRNIYLPGGLTVPANSKIQITCDSGYSVSIHYPNTLTGGWRTKRFSKGQTLVFILVNNVWLNLDDIEHTQYVFGHGFFTATLEADWVRQGMTIEFIAAASGSGEEDKVGILDEIKVGGVTELVITAIDAGFLTPPRKEFTFRDDETAHREYFETAPVSRLVIVQYESMHLTDIVLPSGRNYTEVSDDNGGWHSGDMREYIGKILLSHGIDLANYGISSSKGNSESSHPFTCALLAAHNTVGMYQNGRQVHGGSGGNGMITLDSSIGNEFSHEVGHNYGIGHYPGGFDGSVHRPSSEINSSWGWDSQQNVFNPNFDSSNTGNDQCLNNECQSAYMGKFQYGTDSMAGGSPMWVGSNRFTMYTPHVAKRIQNFLENKAVWDPTSSTGFRKFDQLSKEMKEFVNDSNGQKVPRLYRVPVTTIVGYYDSSETRGLRDYVYPAMHGAYGFIYEDDGGSSIGTATGCELVVKTSNGNRSGNGEKTLVYTLTTDIYHNDFMNKFHVNVATIDGPYKASIYCFNKLRTDRTLDGPKDEQALTFTVNGIAFDDGNNNNDVPTANPVKPSTKSPTFSPTHSPTTAPNDCPEVPQTKFVYKIKNEAPVLRSCKWLAKKSPDQISSTCNNETNCHGSYGSAQAACPATCVFCGECNQNLKAKFYFRTNKKGKVLLRTCNWLASKSDAKKKKLCAKEKFEGCHKSAYQVCPRICYEKSGCDKVNT